MNSFRHIIIVAGGTGSRIDGSLPKQFIEINGKPLIIYTLEKFFQFDDAIRVYIAVHGDYIAHMQTLISKYFANKTIEVTIGGETRFHSVKNALSLLKNQLGITGIHDAARPMVSVQTIEKCFNQASITGNAIPAIPINDSIRKIENGKNYSVNRNTYRIIQTPQCFAIDSIRKAFEQKYDSSFTDDASVFEKAGGTIRLVEGNIENIKITYPSDLIIAQHYLK